MLRQVTEKIEMEQKMQCEIDKLKEELSKLESENAQLYQELSQSNHNSELEVKQPFFQIVCTYISFIGMVFDPK